MRIRLDRNNWVYYIGQGSNLRRLIFSIGCMLMLLGSSFRPAPGPMTARGGSDVRGAMMSNEIQIPEPEDKLVKYSVYEVKRGIPSQRLQSNSTLRWIHSSVSMALPQPNPSSLASFLKYQMNRE